MALLDRLEKHIADLRAERRRIREQADADLAAVEVKLAALMDARGAITPDVEANYARLKAMGLLQEL